MPSSPNEITGLPSASHILLSEFFTRVLDGAARNDTAVKQLAIQQRDLDKVAWGDPSGPGWLTHHLELIRDGHKAYPKADVPDDENYEFNQNYFVRAQRWLERHGRSAADAMSEVAQELARRRHRERQHIALERLLYDRASAGKLIIKAREWDYAKNRASSEYKSIPSGFFLRPCRFYYFVLHGRSELVRDTGDGSPNELDDSVFNRNDPPTSYMMAKIARKDAIALRGLFLATASSEIPEDDFARWAGEEHLTQPEVARRNLLDKVQKGWLTPNAAEARAVELDCSPLKPVVRAEDYDPGKERLWTIAMTLAWIAWRDVQDVRRHWVKYRENTWMWTPINEREKLQDGTIRESTRYLLEHITPTQFSYENLIADAYIESNSGNTLLMKIDEAKQQLWERLRARNLTMTAIEVKDDRAGSVPADMFDHLELATATDGVDVLRTGGFPKFLELRLRSADVLRLWCQKPIGETGNAMLKSRKAKNESSRAPQSKLKPSFEKIRAAKESEEKETGNSIGLLRPRERLKRLTDRMKSMGLKPAEIPHERTFREYFNNGPGKSEKSG